jgi:hypothetical protein
MYSNKTLVGLGCSHTFGEYMGDVNPITCHARSWVRKLEVLANFKDSVNLGAPGGSNHRSERVLLEYLKKNSKDIVVIFSVTELSRFETVNIENWTEDNDGLRAFNREGSWGLYENDKKKKEFLEYFYSRLTNKEVELQTINRKVLLIHSLLKSINIEHYFFEMMAEPGSIIINQLGFEIPMIKFPNNSNATDWMYRFFPRGSCRHFDHDANQALAEYLFNQINIIKGN